MFNITAFSIENYRLTLLTVLLSCLLGIVIFMQYPSKEDPSIVIRQAQISSSFQGMAPSKIEDLITKPIEEKLREISAIKTISSDSKTGISLVKVEVYDNIDDLDAVWQQIRNKMADLSRELPSGTYGPILSDELGLTAIASIALSADGFSYAEMENFAKNLQNKLYNLEGTQKIKLYGVQQQRIFIEFSAIRMAQLGIEASTIVNTLTTQNIILPGGKINADGLNILLEPSGNLQSVDDIKAILISIANTEKLIRLDDIATISRSYVDPPQTPVYFNATPAIILSVSIHDGINSINYGEQLKHKLAQIQSDLPWGVELDFATFQPDLVKHSVSQAINNLYQTIAIVLLVVIIFLGLRSGLIVGSFVPLTMLTAVVFMSVFEVELQRMSIAAMIISLGMLVDNAIVMVESISVRIAAGMSKKAAAIAAGRTLALPLLTSTLTTILFFIPIAMAEGGVGEYTMSLAQVITIVLLLSWFFSLYITPLVGSYFLNANQNINDNNSFFSKFYRNLLQQILRHKILFIAAIIILFISSLSIFSKLDKEFFPLGDRNQFLVYIDLPAGTALSKTDAVVQAVSSWLNNKELNPEIVSSVSYVASGGPRFFLSLSPPDPDPHRGFIVVNTQTSEQVDGLITRVNSHLLSYFPELRAEVKKMWMGASEAGLFELRIIADEHQVLLDQSKLIINALHSIPDMTSTKHDWENKIIKLNVNVDQVQARNAGISSEQIAHVLNGYFSGHQISDYREGDTIIPIIVRGLAAERNTLSDIANISIYSKTYNKTIPLSQIIDISGGWQVGRIKRRNQQRTLTISAKHSQLTALEILQEIQPVLDSMSGNFTLEIAGEIEQQSNANKALFANFPYAIALIILLLIWQFNSFRKTAIILSTIPLILIGATVGLVLMNALFGFMVILGLFSLAGIIINNGIVLLDQIAIEETKTTDRYQALINACVSRFRPIMITTVTTVLGLMPLILSNNALFYGMASAMAFGLAIGSILTLGFVPALYALLFSIKIKQIPSSEYVLPNDAEADIKQSIKI